MGASNIQNMHSKTWRKPEKRNNKAKRRDKPERRNKSDTKPDTQRNKSSTKPITHTERQSAQTKTMMMKNTDVTAARPPMAIKSNHQVTCKRPIIMYPSC